MKWFTYRLQPSFKAIAIPYLNCAELAYLAEWIRAHDSRDQFLLSIAYSVIVSPPPFDFNQLVIRK